MFSCVPPIVLPHCSVNMQRMGCVALKVTRFSYDQWIRDAILSWLWGWQPRARMKKKKCQGKDPARSYMNTLADHTWAFLLRDCMQVLASLRLRISVRTPAHGERWPTGSSNECWSSRGRGLRASISKHHLASWLPSPPRDYGGFQGAGEHRLITHSLSAKGCTEDSRGQWDILNHISQTFTGLAIFKHRL